MRKINKIWKKMSAVCVVAIMLLNVPFYAYAEGFSAEDVFSSRQEMETTFADEERFSSEVSSPSVNTSETEASESNTSGNNSANAENLEMNLQGENIGEADIAGTDISGADIAGTDVTGTNIEEENISDTTMAESASDLEPDGYIPYISTLFLPDAKEGVYYTAQLEGISNNNQSLRWSIGNTNTLPQGLYLTTDGKLTGTPRESGSFILQILADNGDGTAARRLEIRIAKADPVIKAYEMALESDIIDMGIYPSGKQGSSSVRIMNKGQNPLHIKPLPDCQNFEISWYGENESVIEPGNSGYITVRSREGLPDGYYEEKININTEEGLSAQATLKINIGPASQKDYDLKIYPVVIDENDFDDPELRVEVFAFIENIGQKETKITRDTSMLKNYRVDDHSINIDDEEAEDVHRTLKPGESIILCVAPLHEYGSFHEEFYVYTDDGSKFAVPITQEIEDPDYLSDKMKMTPFQIKFDESHVFYEEAPKPQEISVENKSDMAVSLFQQGAVGLRVGKLDKNRLEPGETAKFTVQPAMGLSNGNYSWWVGVNAQSDDGKTAFLSSIVYFNVSEANFEGVDEIPGVTGLTNGTEKTADALRLPYSVRVKGYGDSTFVANVEWNIEECSYDPEVKEEQIFTVKGNLLIPPEQNNKHLDTSAEIQVQVKAYEPLSQPVIDKLSVNDNYLTASLYDKSNEASGYQFVLVKKEADLDKDNFAKTKNSASTSVTIKSIQKGEYYLHCRAYKKDGGKTTYGGWSEGKAVSIEVVTGKAPKITKAAVNGCDVRITVSIPDNAAGFDAVLAKKKSGGEPTDYVVKKINQSAKKKTIVLNGAAKGTYYVGVHSYTYQNRHKVLSPWSNLIKVTVKNGRITTSPVIKKVSVSGRKVTAVISRPKGTAGSDWVLGTHAENNGTYDKVYDYAYAQKNKTGTTITFQNVKPGTYYLAGHAYMKGYTKSFTDWSGIKTIVVK